MTFDILNDALKGGAKTAKFGQIGQTWSGPLVGIDKRQATDFDSGKPEFWDDGNPKEQYVVSIQTELREDENDDGIRAVYIKDWGDQKRALRSALQAFGGTPTNGDIFTATYYADGEKPQRGFAPKLYKYEFKKANPLDGLGAAPEAQQPTQAAPAAPQYQAPVTQAAPAQGQLTGQQAEQIATLVSKGLEDEQIASIIAGVTVQQVATIRVQQGALAGAGF